MCFLALNNCLMFCRCPPLASVASSRSRVFQPGTCGTPPQGTATQGPPQGTVGCAPQPVPAGCSTLAVPAGYSTLAVPAGCSTLARAASLRSTHSLSLLPPPTCSIRGLHRGQPVGGLRRGCGRKRPRTAPRVDHMPLTGCLWGGRTAPRVDHMWGWERGYMMQSGTLCEQWHQWHHGHQWHQWH